jgi:outer membrane protein
MRKTVLFLSILILLLPGFLRAEEISISLDEAVALALRDNREILLKAEDLKQAKARISEAQAGLFPSLSVSGGWSDTRGLYSKDLSQTGGQVNAMQMLYQGGRVINTIKYNEYGMKIAQTLLDKAKLEVILSLKRAFYTLLLAVDYADLNKAILDNAQEHLNSLRAKYAAGQDSASDLLQAEAAISSVKQAYEASFNQVEASQALMNNLLALSKDLRIKPVGKFVYQPEELAFDQAFLKAIATRPEIRQYEAQTKADKSSIEIAKSQGRPSVYASWDYYSRSHAVAGTAMMKNWNDYNIVGLTFSWPIFDGWATKAKVEQAIVDLKQTQLMKDRVLSDIALELKISYVSLKDAIAKIEATNSDLRVYNDNLSSARQKYQEGVASDLDLSDAGLKYDISLFNQKQAVYDYLIAKSSFEKATGGI